jgi:hypothetical protein
MRAYILALLLIAAAGAAHADKLYRWVDEDGKVHYTDQLPPPQARNAERKQLGDRPGDGPTSYALQQALKNFPVTLYVVKECGEGCKSALAFLTRRGIPFTQKDAHQDLNGLKALTGGAMEVPVATVGATVLRGYEEGTWKATLDAAGYPSAPVAPPRAAAAKAGKPEQPAAAPTAPASPAQAAN